MIIKCPECGGDVSDKAQTCPHCGYGLTQKKTDERLKVNPKSEWTPSPTVQPNIQKPKKEKKKHGCLGYIIACVVVIGIFKGLFGGGDSDTADTTSTAYEEYAEPTNTPVEPTPTPIKKTFYEKLEDGIGNKKVAKKTYKVLKKDIGFKKLKYKKKIKGTTNYRINANGYDVVVTASDKLYRIFTPHEYVWYENGKAKNTYKKIKRIEKRTKITNDDMTYYYLMAKEIVKQGLTDPNSAKFPSIVTHPEEIAMKRNWKLVTVQSYADASNVFGGRVRNNWTTQFKVKNKKEYSYEVKYLEIGGQKVYGNYKR